MSSLIWVKRKLLVSKISGEKVGVRGLIGRRWHGARSVLRVTGEDEQNKVRGWRAGGRLTFMTHRERNKCTELSLAAERRRLTSPDILTGRKVSTRRGQFNQAPQMSTGPAVSVAERGQGGAELRPIYASECQFRGLSQGQDVSEADSRQLRMTG